MVKSSEFVTVVKSSEFAYGGRVVRVHYSGKNKNKEKILQLELTSL